MGQLVRRRGSISNMESQGDQFLIQAEVPLAAMFGYATDLRSATQGRATYSMEFEEYAEAPASIAEAVFQLPHLWCCKPTC